MNNPFDLFQNKDRQTEQESHRLRVRIGILLGLFCCLLAAYLGVLFNTQVVNGESYLARSDSTTVRNETVETVRGEIRDRNGNLLVTNQQVHNVVLDTSLMGGDRNQIISDLLALCRAEGVEWTDTFPVSASAPWTYTKANIFCYQSTDDEGNPTLDEDGNTVFYPTLLGSLADKLGWVEDPITDTLTAQELMAAMCDSFGIELEEGQPIEEDTRALLGILYELYLRAYQITYNEYVFAEDVDIPFITKVKEFGLTGVEIDTTTARTYAMDLAAHVIGRVGLMSAAEWPTYQELGYPMNASVGKSGVELAFEEYLHGSNGTRRTEVDEDGNIISEEWAVEPAPGSHAVLTLDATIQATTENLLAAFVPTLENPAGAAAVMVDMTGGILALASYPDFSLTSYSQDYNDLLADPNGPLYNRATQGLYAPGSTFKPLTAIAALSEGVITPSSRVTCTGRYWYYPDYNPACWIYNSTGGNHASESVSEAITDSCNIFFYDVGRRLGIISLVEYATQFGLGQYTGIEITEYKGTVAGPDAAEAVGQQWYGGLTLSAAIGQSYNLFTPVQMANYIATLVNGGNNYQAHLLKEVKSSDYSQTVYQYQPVLRHTIDIDERDLAAVKKGMYDLSKTYSMAYHFSSLPVEVGCKTGTAEVEGSDANAVFVCFAPYENPEVALCIVVEKGASGGNLASIAAGMLAQYFATADGQQAVDPENTLIP